MIEASIDGMKAIHPPMMVGRIPLVDIVDHFPVRRLSAGGLARLRESIQQAGFLENFPLTLLQLPSGKYRVIDGNHRWEAAKDLDLPDVPCVVKVNLTEQECYTLALQSNNAAGTIVPQTLVTYAEFICGRVNEGKTQEDIAAMMGWSRDKVAKYYALEHICYEAWRVIVTTFEESGHNAEEEVVTSNVTTVTFTERLLRSILDLTPEQQLELVQALADGSITKGKFTEQAKAYKARNDMKDYALPILGDLGEASTQKLLDAVYSGAYDADWRTEDHPKLHRLLKALREEWEEQNSIHLIHGDFYEEALKVGTGSVDLILTDPPYNIARENEFELEGRSNISQDYGEWDKEEAWAFLENFAFWATQWARILREQGSGYVFTSDRFLSHLRNALEQAGLHVKATIIWHKTNPGTQVVKTNFKSSVEYILFFTKGEGGHTFNWQGENEMHNFIETPICGGNERLVTAKGKTLHPNQKPEQIMRHFLQISSNRGDVVFDGFAGVGTTGAVAKKAGRKFVGIEQDPLYFEFMQRRLIDG